MLGIGYILGFQCLFLVFIAAIGFLIRRKWRLSVARKAEIKRLLVLAAEEAARVELEATTGYGYGYSYSYSYCHSHINGNSYCYSQTDADAEISAHAETAPHATPSPVAIGALSQCWKWPRL